MKIQFDYKGLEQYQKAMKEQKAAITNEMKKALNNVTDRHLSRCIKNTDVGDSPDSPTLRNNWDRTPVTKTASGYEADVFNPTEYASFYEYGHRQQVGKIIFIELRPGVRKYGQTSRLQKNGKYGIFLRLKAPFVKGRYVLTNSETKAEHELRIVAENVLKKFGEGLK